MSDYARNIAPYVRREIAKSRAAYGEGDTSSAFSYLENAHVLGQASTWWHVKVHYLMLVWAVRQGKAREAVGQLLRIVGATLFTAVGWVPVGNTGGSNVSAIKPMQLREEHAEIIAAAKAGTKQER